MAFVGEQNQSASMTLPAAEAYPGTTLILARDCAADPQHETEL
jgi:hypothetical protein